MSIPSFDIDSEANKFYWVLEECQFKHGAGCLAVDHIKDFARPVVIEAIQFDGENISELMDFAHTGCPPEFNSIVRLAPFKDHLVIRTLEGLMDAFKGDWIVKGIKGEFYPVKDDIFKLTYEVERLKEAGK